MIRHRVCGCLASSIIRYQISQCVVQLWDLVICFFDRREVSSVLSWVSSKTILGSYQSKFRVMGITAKFCFLHGRCKVVVSKSLSYPATPATSHSLRQRMSLPERHFPHLPNIKVNEARPERFNKHAPCRRWPQSSAASQCPPCTSASAQISA